MRKWNWVRSLVFGTLLAAGAFAALFAGRYSAGPQEILDALAAPLLPGSAPEGNAMNVVWNIRVPRIFLAMLSGAGLALAGAAFQSIFANPLATPDTLGVANGASFGAALAILLGLGTAGIQTFALLGGVAAVALALSISRIRGTSTVFMMILAGMVVSSFFQALVSLVKYVADPQDILPSITYWLMGSMKTATRRTLLLGAPLIVVGSALIVLLRWKLNAMSLPEEEAQALGVRVKQIRILMIAAAAMVTASVISMCGQIGWVGLLVPHIARLLYGNDNRSVVPASIFFGAAFMLLMDTIARTATAAEIPVSILTAVCGAPVFIFLLRRTARKGGGGVPGAF